MIVFASAAASPPGLARDEARQEKTLHRFDIEEDNAAVALNMLAEQAGAPILFPYDRVVRLQKSWNS